MLSVMCYAWELLFSLNSDKGTLTSMLKLYKKVTDHGHINWKLVVANMAAKPLRVNNLTIYDRIKCPQ